MGKKRLIDANDVIIYANEFHFSETFKVMLQKILDKCKTVMEYSDDPLSLEELKEIDGKYPVWVEGLNDKNFNINEYATLENDTETNFYVKFIGCGLGHSVNHKNYGKTWFAYLRKPESV